MLGSRSHDKQRSVSGWIQYKLLLVEVGSRLVCGEPFIAFHRRLVAVDVIWIAHECGVCSCQAEKLPLRTFVTSAVRGVLRLRN